LSLAFLVRGGWPSYSAEYGLFTPRRWTSKSEPMAFRKRGFQNVNGISGDGKYMLIKPSGVGYAVLVCRLKIISISR